MLEKNKQEILDQNYFLNKRKDAKKKTKFIAQKHRFFLLSVFLGLVIILLAYYFSNYSNIYHISIDGNIYYDDETIRELSGITSKDKFLLVSGKKVKANLENDSLIEEATVTKLNNNLINIVIKEYKIIGYINSEEGPFLVLENDTRIPVTRENMYLITSVPIIEGYDDEGLKLLERGFASLDQEIIKNLSEIHRYPFSYDENMMEIIMDDGNYLFVSYDGLKLLNPSNYYSVISKLQAGKEKVCILLDEHTNTMQSGKCPWEKVEVPEEENKPEE